VALYAAETWTNLSDLASSAKYMEVKRAAEDRKAWRGINRRGMS